MARVHIVYDTATGALGAVVDGTSVFDLREVHIVRGEQGEDTCSLLTVPPVKGDELPESQELMPATSRGGRAALREGHGELSRRLRGFVETSPTSRLAAAIGDFLARHP